MGAFFESDRETAWEYYKELDRRIQQRENYILVAESMLLLSYVTAFTSHSPFGFQTPVAIVGIVITLSWYYANLRLLIQSEILIDDYLFENPVIKRSITSVIRYPNAKNFLHDLLPGSVLLLWIYLLYFSLYSVATYDIAKEIFIFYFLVLMLVRLLIYLLLPRKPKKDC